MTEAVRWAERAGPRTLSTTSIRGAPREFQSSMPSYRPTPLVEVPDLAAELNVATVLVKQESSRLGLPAFKILGASWAVNCALSQRSGIDGPATSLNQLRERCGPTTLVTATDGNHGRAVARMAALLGLSARIYVPGGTAEHTVEKISSEGAEVVQTNLMYDDVVRAAASSTAGRPDDLLIQDTAWQDYEQIPSWIVDGYGTLFAEIDEQLGERTIHLVVVPTGVGSLLQAALQHYRDPALQPQPAVLAVEPITAACVAASLAEGRPVSVKTSAPTIMAGLNCGTVSTIAWPAIRDGLDAGVAVSDDQTRAAMRRLNELGIPAGPSAAASLAGVRVALGDPHHRAALAISEESALVLISTEGAV
jgi:diaminopropionate ammonia-lyase